MKLPRSAFSIPLALALASAPVYPQNTTGQPLLVDVNWLSRHLNDRDLVILHVGDEAGYKSAHIPGARFITMESVSRPMAHDGHTKELMIELPSKDELQKKIAAFGISDDSRIVVYYATDGVVPAATRIVFTLDSFGLGDHTSVLNGGMSAWRAAGMQLTAVIPPPGTGKLSPHKGKKLVVNADFVKSDAHKAGYKLVDARAEVFYKGIEPTYEKSGHIPGAVNIPFTQITDNKQNIDRDRAEAVFKAAGVAPGDTVVAYCHIGMQATEVLFAARLLGHAVLLYDGAFEDWATNNRGPVEK
jgi:thiosulfate/3-mercaptopyruvate sulfurtransferase